MERWPPSHDWQDERPVRRSVVRRDSLPARRSVAGSDVDATKRSVIRPDDADMRRALARRMPDLPPSTTIIPAVQKPVRLTRPVPLSGPARARTTRFSVLAVLGALVVLVFLSFTPLAAVAHPIVPWAAQGDMHVYPTPTPSRPVAAGEHAFVCAALPFARLAQQEMVTGQRPQPYPWRISVIMSQWGIEQGWTIPGYTGYNWGNSSALDGFPSVSGTNQPGSPTRFAYATSAEQGVQIYVAFVQNGLYDAVAAAYPQGAQAQALALGQSPWDANHYTGTGHPGSSLLNVMAYYGLQRLDKPGATCNDV